MPKKFKGCPECGSLLEGRHKTECSFYKGPDEAFKKEVQEATDSLKKDLWPLFEKYSETFAKLARNNTDPHTPVIASIQIGLAQTAAEYLVSKGVMANIACEMVLHATGAAMSNWGRALLAQANANKTVLHKDGPANVQ